MIKTLSFTAAMAAAFVAIPSSSRAQEQIDIATVAHLGGECRKLVIGDTDASAHCEPKVVNVAYDTGKSSFQFVARGKAVIGFFGTDNRAKGDEAVLDVEKITLNLLMGTPSTSDDAKGSCTYTNPYAGRSTIRCKAVVTRGQTFEASFVSDGKEPSLHRL